MKSGVFIGRFQPLHRGHVNVIKQALAECDKLTIILGSARSARSLRNPFRFDEREVMLRQGLLSSGFTSQDLSRISVRGVRDYFYNVQAWIAEVREKVGDGPSLLYGLEKDASGAYLNWFPDWERTSHESQLPALNATSIRESYLRDSGFLLSKEAISNLPSGVLHWLENFSKVPSYEALREEQLAIDEYRLIWQVAPFPPVFVTTDSMVVQAGHILLIQRKRAPGKGLWALPGGFLDPNESLAQCAVRELKEETQFSISSDELVSYLKIVRAFDHPLRSSRGRTITHLHYFDLPGDRVSKVSASDDAASAKWVPIFDVAQMEDEFFEDHFHMIQSALKARSDLI